MLRAHGRCKDENAVVDAGVVVTVDAEEHERQCCVPAVAGIMNKYGGANEPTGEAWKAIAAVQKLAAAAAADAAVNVPAFLLLLATFMMVFHSRIERQSKREIVCCCALLHTQGFAPS